MSTKTENLLALIAETHILIIINQVAQAGKLEEAQPIISNLETRLKDIMQDKV